ncbi:MAG: hypothetical protein OEV78_02990 [Spirochaetia bacterium]|nr:hypothetical protein [Spirochaetia bacterium]
MEYFLLPPSLSGLSYRERNKLKELPWKNGQIDDLAGGDFSFILISGQLYDDEKRFYDPAREILGIKPFFKNIKKNYHSNTPHRIVYIETKILALFFLEFPKAMQSYVLYETNAGNESLNPWKKFPRIWTVVSIQSGWQGIHFAFTIAAYFANKKNKKTVYLEMNPAGMSIYSFIQKEPKPPIMHIKDDRTFDPAILLMERTLTYENVDIINVQHLSQWKISREQWVSFYNILSIKYDNIIIHCGEELTNFFHEESDGLFIMRKYRTYGYPGLHPAENSDLWPPTLEIFTTSLPALNDREIKYPLFFKKIIDLNEIPFYNKLDDSFWKWFEKYPARLLNQEKVIVLGECSPSMVDSSIYLTQILKENENLSDFLTNNMVIAEGATSIMMALQSISKYNPKLIQKIFKKIKPVYPQNGFYSNKSFVSLLNRYFKNVSQDFLHLNFSSFSNHDTPLQWFTHGLITDSLESCVFPPYCLELTGKIQNVRNFYSSNKAQWHEHVALALRFGFKNIDFYEFIIPDDTFTSVFAERFIISYNSIKNYVNLTGEFTKHYYVFKK